MLVSKEKHMQILVENRNKKKYEITENSNWQQNVCVSNVDAATTVL